MSRRNPLSTILIAGMLLVAAIVTLGKPDFGLAGQFLSGIYPSEDAAVALISIICYALVFGIVAIAVFQGFRSVSEGQLVHQRSARALLFFLAGMVVLGLGTANRIAYKYAICCGGAPQYVQEAQNLAH